MTDPHNAVITYSYNAVGSLSQVKYPDNKTVSYTYTPSNQLSTAKDWNNQTTTYLYDNEARLATKTLPNTIKATYAYDENGNLSTLTYKKGTSSFAKYAYTRDNTGNITEEDETKANGSHAYTDYTYDAADQLTMADAPTDTYNYTYDDVGNMATSQNGSGTSSYSYNNGNQLSAKTGVGARSFTYDNQGNEVTDGSKALVYNYDNQLKSYTSGSTTTNYVYDALGSRIEKNTGSTPTTQYVNTGSEQVLVTKNVPSTTYSYNVYGSDLVSQGDTSSSSRQYFVTDGMGNVKYLTNSSGATISGGTYSYDPYGNQIGGTASTSFAYQAEAKDTESGLTYLRARYYDPSIGRFTSQDPMSGNLGNPATQNGYNYTGNNPINYSDPSGMFSVTGSLSSGIGALYNAVVPKTGITGVDNFVRTVTGVDDITNNLANCNWGGLAIAVGTTVVPEGKVVKGVSVAAKIARTENFARGVASEARVLNDLGLTKNTAKFVGTEATSIPDILGNFVGEIKDVKTVSLTKQLKTHAEAARALTPGVMPVLITGVNTHISSNVREVFDIVTRGDLGPR